MSFILPPVVPKILVSRRGRHIRAEELFFRREWASVKREVTRMIHYRTEFRGRPVSIRDIEERDVEHLVQYWHQSTATFLQSLGVDLSKLKTPEETRSRFRDSIPRGALPRTRIAYLVESNDTLVAYTNLNLPSNTLSSDQGCAHFHVLTRNAWARAVCYLLFPKGIQAFFSTVPVKKIIFQISPENQNARRMIERFELQGRVMNIEKPDGMARPGLFNVYEILRGQPLSLASKGAGKERK